MENYFLGVDVSKGYADFVILNSKKKCVKENFQLDDTFEGHCYLYERLLEFTNTHPESYIYAAVESTGGYENNWFNSLVKYQGSLNIKTSRLNPLGVSANSKADLKRNITDKISAQNVAEYLIAHSEKVSYVQEDYFASLRKQWIFIKMLTKQSTQLLNQLESLVYSANPQLLGYCGDGMPEWILKLLIKYPTAAKLSKAKSPLVAKIPYISLSRAIELIANAKKSIASATDEITEQLIAANVKQILHLKESIKLQTQIMTQKYSAPEVDLLKTFTGIGTFSAIGLLLEIQSVRRFASVKRLSSFFGLHPAFKISGDGSSGMRMSKKGRKEPRHLLFMVALSAMQSNPIIKNIYKKKLKEGMPKMAAIGVCMHKTLRIIYGMLKHNKKFDPTIDIKNSEKSSKCKDRVREDKNRRYQTFDANAPISGRQKNKRKEQKKQSHRANNPESGIYTPVPSSV